MDCCLWYIKCSEFLHQRLNEQIEAAKQLEEEKKQIADTAVSLQQNLEVGISLQHCLVLISFPLKYLTMPCYQ